MAKADGVKVRNAQFSARENSMSQTSVSEKSLSKTALEDGSEAKRGKRRGSYRKGLQRRMDIVEAATEIFAHSGYHNAALISIAKASGVTQSGLLHHFPSKVDLLLAVLDSRDARTTKMFKLKGKDWQSQLRGFVDVARYNQTIPGVVRAFSILATESLTEEHPAADWFAKRTFDIRDTILDCLRSGRDQGAVKGDVDLDSVASEIMAVMDGLQLQWLRDETRVDMVGILHDYIERRIRDLQNG
jgi:AcrR family transcriptional regulator